MLRRVIGVLVIPALVLGALAPAPALALAPPAAGETDEDDAPGEGDEDGEDEDDEPDPLEEARRLFDEGAVEFETADYADAIELWTEAFGMVPSEPEYASIKARLIANLAEAQKRAYEVDGFAEHLNQAKILLLEYRGAIDSIYPSAVERDKEFAWVDGRLAEIEAELKLIAEREAAAAAGPPKTGKGLRIGGAVMIALGAGSFGMMGAGLALGSKNNDISDLPTNDLDARLSRYQRGRAGNAMAIAGSVAGSVLLGVGIALVVVGVKRKQALAKEEPAEPELGFTPMLGPDRLGVGLVGRF